MLIGGGPFEEDTRSYRSWEYHILYQVRGVTVTKTQGTVHRRTLDQILLS
jgi:hypothetical protein